MPLRTSQSQLRGKQVVPRAPVACNDAQWVVLPLYPAFRRKIEILSTLGYGELSW